MPYSYPLYKEDVKRHIVDGFPYDMRILDVGPGSGCYADMLREYFPFLDGLEIFPQYVKDFNLEMKYRKIIVGDIRDFDFSLYDYIIMGDVLEHMSVTEAQTLLEKIEFQKKCLMVAVPYLYEQGVCFDNVHEIHHQPDLTHSLFVERYPHMNLLVGDEKYGYYINY